MRAALQRLVDRCPALVFLALLSSVVATLTVLAFASPAQAVGCTPYRTAVAVRLYESRTHVRTDLGTAGTAVPTSTLDAYMAPFEAHNTVVRGTYARQYRVCEGGVALVEYNTHNRAVVVIVTG